MAKNRKKLKKLLNQLREDQYLEIDDATINVVNKKTKNVVVSINIFSDYEHDEPYEEEIESVEGDYVLTTDTVDESTSIFHPMIVVNKEITEEVKTPAIDEATGEQMYDRDDQALYYVEEETRVEEVVINTNQIITETIYIPPTTEYNMGRLVTTPSIQIEPGSWYYIKMQLEESFKLGEIKKAIDEFEKMAPAVLGESVKVAEDTKEPEYLTLQEVLEEHRNAIKNSPNTFFANGDILYIGSYGDGKYEFKTEIDPTPTDDGKIPVTDIIDPAHPDPDDPLHFMQLYDRDGNPIYYLNQEDVPEKEIVIAIIIDEHGLVIHTPIYEKNKGTQKVIYYFERSIQEYIINAYKDTDKEDIYNLFSTFDKEDDYRYVDYPDGSTFDEGYDEFEEEYCEYCKTNPPFNNNLPPLRMDSEGNFIAPPDSYGWRFRKGDVKQVRQGGIFTKYTKQDIDEELNKAIDEAIKNGKDPELVKNAYAKINVGDFKSWQNITSKYEKDIWSNYMAKMANNTDTVKRINIIKHEEKMHFYKIHVAYIKCMSKILINLGYADWVSKPGKGDEYTVDRNYIIETDLDSMASIPLEEVEDTLSTVIDDTNDLIEKLDQCIYGYSKYPGDPFPGFQTQYDEERKIFTNMNYFANRYWGLYEKEDYLTEVDIMCYITKVRKAKSKEKKVSTEKYYPKEFAGYGSNSSINGKQWVFDRGMFLYYIMMYQAKLFYCIVLKTIIDIIKQLQEYLSLDEDEYKKFLKNSAFTTKAKNGQMVNDVKVTDDKGKQYSRKSNSWKNVNRKMKKMFKKHFLTYYKLILDLFNLDDYVTDKFIIAFNKSFKKQIIEYENVPSSYIITDKNTINYYTGDRSKDYANKNKENS